VNHVQAPLIIENYDETGSLNEQVRPQGFSRNFMVAATNATPAAELRQ
jgi:hypothetical protein